jgi:4-amino-4-deoxy-L-arabinose transferase-like glycosyltransferase
MNRRIQHLAFGLVLFVSLALRLFHINSASYWIDEMTSVHIAKSPYLTSVFWDNCPFLYHLLLKVWILLVGDAELATRGLSVIFSVATTAALMFYCNRRYGFRTGISAGILHAVYPLSVAYAQETRMYAQFEFFAAINMICFFDLREKRRGSGAYLASVVLLALSHYLAVIPIALQTALLIKGKSKSTALKAGAASLLVVAASYFISFSWAHLEWQRLKFMVEPQAGHVQEVVLDLLYGSWPALIGIVGLIAYWIWKEKRQREALTGIRILAGTLLLLMVCAFLFQRSVFHARYYIFLVPYVVISLAVIAERLTQPKARSRWAATAALLVIAAFSADSIVQGDFRAAKAPWRTLAKQVAKDPASMVFTTRTLAIRSPYFERENIPVEFISSPGQAGEMAELAALGATVWIVDAYWASITYVPGLVDALKAKGLEAEEFVFKTGKSDVIVAVRVTSGGS